MNIKKKIRLATRIRPEEEAVSPLKRQRTGRENDDTAQTCVKLGCVWTRLVERDSLSREPLSILF